MESKKTESNKKPGWDAKNKVLTDNFGNVYDLKNKTVNGMQCKEVVLEEHNVGNDHLKLIEITAMKGQRVKLHLGQDCTAEVPASNIMIDKDNQMSQLSLTHAFDNGMWRNERWSVKNGGKELWKDGTGEEYGLLWPEYVNGTCKTLRLKNVCRASETAPEVKECDGYEILADDNLIKIELEDIDENIHNVQISTIEQTQADLNTKKVFQQKFKDESYRGIQFVDKVENWIYFFEETKSNKAGVAQGNLLVYDTRVNKIVQKTKINNLKEDYTDDDLHNLVEHYTPRGACDVNKILIDINAYRSNRLNNNFKNHSKHKHKKEKRDKSTNSKHSARERSREKEIEEEKEINNNKAHQNQKNTTSNDTEPCK